MGLEVNETRTGASIPPISMYEQLWPGITLILPGLSIDRRPEVRHSGRFLQRKYSDRLLAAPQIRKNLFMRFTNKIPFVIALFLLTVPLFAGTYSTTFPLTENPISDGGQWQIRQSSDATRWGAVQTNGTMAYGVSQPGTFGDPTAILTGTWGPDQTVQGTVKIGTPSSRGHEIELRLRTTISSASITGYETYCSITTGEHYCYIARWNGPVNSYCNIQDAGFGTPTLATGDVLKATVTGTNPVSITLYRQAGGTGSFTQVAHASDNGSANYSDCPGGAAPGGVPFTSGNPGIGFWNAVDSNWNWGWSSFTASDGGPLPPSGLSATVH